MADGVLIAAGLQAGASVALVGLTGWFSWRSHVMSGRVAEAETLPHLTVSAVLFGPKGLHTETWNHGAGIAQSIDYKACLVRGHVDVTTRTEADPTQCPDCEATYVGSLGSLGPGQSNRRRLIPWDDVPTFSGPGEKWSLLVFFEYSSALGRQRSNPHWMNFERVQAIQSP